VQPWWRPQDLDEVTQAVGAEIAVEPWILVVDGRDAGYFQVYDVGCDAAYGVACASVGAGPGTAGMDYLIGEPSLIGGGIGTRAIAAFVAEIVFGRGSWPAVCAGPDPANAASIRVLEKNGFVFAGRIDTDDGPEHLMVRTRAEEPTSEV
jgi:aminoglycoside 6'-N-acetyltransferase